MSWNTARQNYMEPNLSWLKGNTGVLFFKYIILLYFKKSYKLQNSKVTSSQSVLGCPLHLKIAKCFTKKNELSLQVSAMREAFSLSAKWDDKWLPKQIFHYLARDGNGMARNRPKASWFPVLRVNLQIITQRVKV